MPVSSLDATEGGAPDARPLPAAHQTQLALIAALAAFLFQFEANVVSVALPSLAQVHHATMTMTSFIVIAYLMTTTVSLMPAGQLAARFGHRPVFLWGCSVYLVGTLLSGLAPNLPFLCGSRLAQGAGAGAMVASAYGLIPAWLEPSRTGWAFGLVSVGAGLGMVLGVPIGGFLSSTLPWQWLFLVVVPPTALLLLASWHVVPKAHPARKASPPFDGVGTALFAIALAALTLAMSLGSELGWASTSILSMVATSAACATLLGLRSRGRRSTYLPAALYQLPRLQLGLAILFAYALTTAGVRFLFPFYLRFACGISSMTASLVLLAFPMAYALASHWSGPLSDRIGSRGPVVTASLVGGVALLVFALSSSAVSVWLAAASLTALGASGGLFYAPNNRHVMAQVPLATQSETGALLPVALNLGSMLGVASFETVFSLFLKGGLSPGEETLSAHLNEAHEVTLAFGYSSALAIVILTLSAFMAWFAYEAQPSRS